MRSTRERDGQDVKNSYLGQVGVVANLGIHGYSGDDSGRRDDQDNHRGEQIVASWRHSSPWNVHWTEQRMSHPKFTNPLYETVISYWRHSENKRTQERLKRITGRYTRSSGTTTSSIGRERDRDCFESQRPNGRTARALSDARALFEIKKMLTCFVDDETTGSWKPNDEIARCHEKSRINAQDESREKRTYRLTLYTLFVGRVNDTEDGAELRPLHAWTPVTPTTPPKRVFGIPYCRLPSVAADFPPP